MNLQQLIDTLPEHPQDVFVNGQGVSPTEDGFYLYAFQWLHHDEWLPSVWCFSTIKEFVDFLPAICFYDIALNWEDYDMEDEDNDYSKEYEEYQTLLNEDWDFEKCVKFVKNFKVYQGFDLIEFGKISDLLNVSQEEYEKCEDDYDSLDEIEELGLTEGRYVFFRRFQGISEKHPSKDKDEFFKMLEEWI